MKKLSYRFKVFCIGILLYTTFPIAWWIRPFLDDDETICIFRKLTGMKCPFCGLTRSFASAVHGEYDVAFGYHYLWPLVALIVFILGTLCIIESSIEADSFVFIRKIWELPVWLFLIVLLFLTLVRL